MLLVVGSLGARQSREEPAVPGWNVVFMNLRGSLPMGPVAQMTHSQVLQDSSFFLEKSGRKQFIPQLVFIRNSLGKNGQFCMHFFLTQSILQKALS